MAYQMCKSCITDLKHLPTNIKDIHLPRDGWITRGGLESLLESWTSLQIDYQMAESLITINDWCRIKMRKLWLRKGRITILLSLLICIGFLWMYTDSIFVPIYYYLNPNIDWVYYHDKTRPKFLCTVYQGGIGNLLFQYTFSYMLSKQKNLTLLIDQDKLSLLQDVFQISNASVNQRDLSICQHTPKIYDKIDVGYEPSVVNLPNNTDIYYEGYFQSWVYWADYEKEIRKQLRFHPPIIAKAKRVLSEALMSLNKYHSAVTLVGIHVRRGDMLTNDYFKEYGYNIADEAYLVKAMKYMRDHIKGEIIYIACSNDMNWTKKALNESNVMFIEGTPREVDMAILTLCDHLILTVGTFGWWTGFLSKGTVVYYDKPFRPGTELAKNWASTYRTTFFYPGWVGLS